MLILLRVGVEDRGVVAEGLFGGVEGLLEGVVGLKGVRLEWGAEDGVTFG